MPTAPSTCQRAQRLQHPRGFSVDQSLALKQLSICLLFTCLDEVLSFTSPVCSAPCNSSTVPRSLTPGWQHWQHPLPGSTSFLSWRLSLHPFWFLLLGPLNSQNSRGAVLSFLWPARQLSRSRNLLARLTVLSSTPRSTGQREPTPASCSLTCAWVCAHKTHTHTRNK